MTSTRIAEAQRVLDLVRSNPGVSKNGVRKGLGMTQAASDRAIDKLAESGCLRVDAKPGSAGGYRYRLYPEQQNHLHIPILKSARVTGADLDHVPDHPMQDKVAASYALWHYMRAQARKTEMPEQHQGRDGWLWEGTLTGAAVNLWPELTTAELKVLDSALRLWLRTPGNIHCVDSAVGKPSTWWISEAYVHSNSKQRVMKKRPREEEKTPVTSKTVQVRSGSDQLVPSASDHSSQVDALNRKVGDLEEENLRLRDVITGLEGDKAGLGEKLNAAQQESRPEQDMLVQHLLQTVRQAAATVNLLDPKA